MQSLLLVVVRAFFVLDRGVDRLQYYAMGKMKKERKKMSDIAWRNKR